MAARTPALAAILGSGVLMGLILAAAILAAQPSRQLGHAVPRAVMQVRSELCRHWGFFDADTVTVCGRAR